MSKRKIILFNLIAIMLLISMLPEISLRVNIPVCREAEKIDDLLEIEDAKSSKKDFRSMGLFHDADAVTLVYSIAQPCFFVQPYENICENVSLYFLSNLFKNPPPLLV